MSEILVGLDGSPGAGDALAFATRLARATGAPLEQIRVSGASPPHSLHEAAKRSGAALIVVGSTHRGPVGSIVPGSTAERLLHGSPCAVAVVPAGYAAVAPDLATIGVGYNGFEETQTALDAGCRLAAALGARLRVIHVFDATRVGQPALMTGPAWIAMRDEHEAAQREELDRAVAELPGDLEVEARFVRGRPGETLARESEAVDLLVVGSRGHGPLATVMLGGASHTLLRHAACPVIVVPRGAGELDALVAPLETVTA